MGFQLIYWQYNDFQIILDIRKNDLSAFRILLVSVFFFESEEFFVFRIPMIETKSNLNSQVFVAAKINEWANT